MTPIPYQSTKRVIAPNDDWYLMIHGLYLETTMKKSALIQLSMTLALFISAIHFVLFWGQQYGTFFSSLRGVLFLLLCLWWWHLYPLKTNPS